MKKTKSYKWILYFLVCCIGIWVVWNWYGNFLDGNFCLEHIGSQGDKYGGLNTFFSGFVFAGILVTIYMQIITT